MARSRKSHKGDEENTKERRGPVQYPYVIYATYNPGETFDTTRWLIEKFINVEAARNHVAALIGEDDYEEATFITGHKMIVTERGVRISPRFDEQFDEIMSESLEGYTSSPAINYFKFRKTPERVEPEGDDDLPKAATGARKIRAEKKAPKEPKPKVDKTGMVSANDIAKELGVEGREVRGVLRAMKLEKPEGGWIFDKKTADEIREKVKKGLKKK